MLSNLDKSDALTALAIHCYKSLDQCFFHPTFYRIYIGSFLLELEFLSSYHDDLYEKFYHKLIMEVLSRPLC